MSTTSSTRRWSDFAHQFDSSHFVAPLLADPITEFGHVTSIQKMSKCCHTWRVD
jgi:hypothetical protein